MVAPARHREEPVVRLAIGVEGACGGQAVRAANGLCSAWRRHRRIGPDPANANNGGAKGPRGGGLALTERAGVIETDLPEGVQVRVDSGVNERALRRELPALRGPG
jgi:hypothetical protein